MAIDYVTSDAIEWANNYKGEKFHALLCDPPYELNFMGKNWDKSGVSFNPETWETLASVLYDGAFGMAFASSRGWHRLACAIEDAGLIIHPSVFGWAFGSGFPKATRVDTQIQPKSEQIIVGIKKNTYDGSVRNPENHRSPAELSNIGKWGLNQTPHGQPQLEPTDELAKPWTGHRYGLQALKPALEPIIVFQKPYSGKPVENITRTGAGALNVDGGRIPTNGEQRDLIQSHRGNGTGSAYSGGIDGSLHGSVNLGKTDSARWPANFLLLDKKTVRVYTLMDSISDEIKQTIKEYYHDYSPMRAMWQVEEDLPVEIETEPSKVLQSEMLRGMVERELSWRQTPDVREKAQAGINREDEGERSTDTVLSESEALREREGMVYEQGLQVRGGDGRGLGEIQVDGEEKRQLEMERTLHTGTSASDGARVGTPVGEVGNSTPHQRRQIGQPDRESAIATSRGTHKRASKDVRRSSRFTEGERRIAETRCFVAETDIPQEWMKYFEPTRLSVVYDPAEALDRQSGELASHGGGKASYGGIFGNGNQVTDETAMERFRGDTGGASRFFFRVSEQIDEADPVYYCAKASRRERDSGLEEMPLKKRAQQYSTIQDGRPHMGDDYEYPRGDTRNSHPTVKPIALAKYLATLLLPPVEYAPRRLCVPFAGVASECIGAFQAGWEYIVGVDSDTEHGYADIARARIDYWCKKMTQMEMKAQ